MDPASSASPPPPPPLLEHLFSTDQRYHGKGPVLFAWHPRGTYVASSGNSRVVHVFGRRGEVVDQIVPAAPTEVTALEWDAAGEVLAIMQANSPIVVVWNLETNRKTNVDTNHGVGAGAGGSTKDLTFLRWSRQGGHLAIGTGKGALILYDRETGEKVVASGRGHKRRIMCGDWSDAGTLAYASEDRQITICRADGTPIDELKVKSRPFGVKFGGTEDDAADGGGGILSVNMEGKTILLYNPRERNSALELAFQPRYGTIVSYEWFGDGSIMVGFASGYFVIISTHMDEIGREQFCRHIHLEGLSDIALCDRWEHHNRAATCSANTIKLVDVSDFKELAATVIEEEHGAALQHLQFTRDGSILSASSTSGCLYHFQVHGVGEEGRSGGAAEPSSSTLLGNTLVRPLPMLALFVYVVFALLVLLKGAATMLEVTEWDLVLVILSGAPRI